MRFGLVEFVEDSSVDVVLISWLADDKCFWPPYRAERLLNAVRKSEEPLLSCWRPICRREVSAVVLQIGSNGLTSDRCSVEQLVADCSEYIQYIQYLFVCSTLSWWKSCVEKKSPGTLWIWRWPTTIKRWTMPTPSWKPCVCNPAMCCSGATPGRCTPGGDFPRFY